MIAEIRDPSIVNGFANHPEIAPEIGGGDLDLSAGMRPPNAFLFGGHGGFCFIWSAPETYETHVMLTRAGRGRWGVSAAKQAIDLMRQRGMTHLWCRVHPERPHVAAYARLCGLSDTGMTHTLDAGDGPVAWRIFNRRY